MPLGLKLKLCGSPTKAAVPVVATRARFQKQASPHRRAVAVSQAVHIFLMRTRGGVTADVVRYITVLPKGSQTRVGGGFLPPASPLLLGISSPELSL